MGRDLVIPPRPLLPRIAASLGRLLLGLTLGLLRFLLVVVVETAILLVRIVLWFRWVFLWLGVFVAVMALLDYRMEPAMWRVQLAGGIGGILMIALSRAGLLLDDSLNCGQRRLRAWVQNSFKPYG